MLGGGPKFLFVMVGVVTIDYVAALCIDIFQKQNRMLLKRLCFIIAVLSNVGILGYYKYMNFIVENINGVFGSNIAIREIVLPIGISFFTFQALSYVIDVYKADVRAQKNYFYVMLYVSLFPQLVAGPIVRYKTIEDEITNRRISQQDIVDGLERFILGLAKKVILANKLGELADLIYNGEQWYAATLWLAAIAYMLQIYFDFSAYSDMAIGLGRIFGFHFNENFNFPYISKSVTEFWRRWHISLSTWFRDYIYIPLGGNRCSKIRWIFNLFIVWSITGIWHGAEWNFILWGLYYFVFLIVEKLFLGEILNKLPKIVQHIYALFIIYFGWIVFRIESLAQIKVALQLMFGMQLSQVSLTLVQVYLHKYGIYLLIAILFSMPVYRWVKEKVYQVVKNKARPYLVCMTLKYAGLLSMFFITILFLVNSTYNPFIYFRF